MENYEDIDIKRILEIILSKKLLIVLILLFSILFGYAYSYYYKKPEYKSSVTILLVADENKTNKELTQTDLNINNGLISTYSSIAKSTNVVQKTIENLELNMSASSLQKKVDAKQIDSTQFLKISVTNANPELAKNIANELANVFTQQIKEIYNLQNISIVDEAEVESTPCNVNHMKDIIMFAFAGLFLAMVSVVAIFMFDDTIKSEEDIEKNVKLKAIGTLPVDKEKNELIVKNNPKSQIVESIKTIRTNILYSTNKNAILVTSCKQDEGKTWVINNLAVTFAQTGKRVILVDANLREENNKNDIFEIDKGEGLSDFIKEISEDNLDNLQKSRNYIKETKIPNLHILQNGTIPPNPVELVSSRNMQKIIKLLKNMYDVVLIDGTSSIMVSDSIALSSMVDSTILIAENKKTKNKFLELIDRPYIKRVSILGGEPLAEQNLDGVLDLIQTIREKYPIPQNDNRENPYKLRVSENDNSDEIRISFPEKTIWLYTGYQISEIVKQEQYEKVSGIPDIWSKRWEIISNVNVIVDGEYIDEERDVTLKWRGSKNQRVIDVQQSLTQNKLVLYCD